MAIKPEDMAADEAAFAARFAEDEPKKTEPTADEVFGLTDPAPAETGNKDGEGDPAPAPAPAPTEEEPAPPAKDQAAEEARLREWEERLNAQQQEVDAAKAAAENAKVEEQQTSAPAKKPDAEGEGGDDDEPREKDPAAALAEDFGPEFVTLLTAFIKQVAGGSVKDSLDGLRDTVQGVITFLEQEGSKKHHEAIKAAHADYMEIVESPAFTSWKDGMDDEKKADVERIVAGGSAAEIVAMLTEFKASQASASGDGNDSTHEDMLDAAEGVRSGGLRLPDDEDGAGKDDYAAAWGKF